MPSLHHVSFPVSRSFFSPASFPLPLSSSLSQDRWIRLVRNELRIEHKAAQFKVSTLPPAHSLPFPLTPSALVYSSRIPVSRPISSPFAPYPLFCSCPLLTRAYGSPLVSSRFRSTKKLESNPALPKSRQRYGRRNRQLAPTLSSVSVGGFYISRMHFIVLSQTPHGYSNALHARMAVDILSSPRAFAFLSSFPHLPQGVPPASPVLNTLKTPFYRAFSPLPFFTFVAHLLTL
jgi:hypothetical protein